MQLKHIQPVYFSPTHTSAKIVTMIAEGMDIMVNTEIDLTYPSADQKTIPSDTLAIIGVPTYAGRIAPTALERLQKIKGDNTPAIIVVLYGNRDYEDALLELRNTAKQLGFVPIAGGAFIGEHSYSTEEFPTAAGRPDVSDIQIAAEFGKNIIKQLDQYTDIKELPVLDTPKDNLLGRTSYDECVQWTCDMFDDAAGRLPATRTGSEYGLATSVAAKALKARLLLYAASPLFNGNTEYYSDFVNTDGSSLMPLSYDENKWKKAADAALEAINLAESNGYSLYEMREGDLSGYPEPQDLTQRTLRFTFMDKDNSKEVLFAETRKAGAYGLQPKSLPYLSDGSWNGVAPTLTMVERFYTKNGLPIDDDPEFDYQNRFSVVPFPDGATYGEGQTIKLNVDREPRFYAWIAFQNGYYECQTESKENAYVAKAERAEGKKWLTDFTEQGNCGKQGRNNNYSKTGYLNKKGVHPGVAASKSQKEPSKDYPWPVIRLAELYLSYAEACIAYNKDGYLEKGMVKLDRIRERAGLLSVKDSWKNAKNPIVSYEGNGGLNGKLTEIVRQERMIELYLEQQNFWDIRRWKLGDKYFNVPVKGMNIDATDINGFATVKTLPDVRNFDTPRQYLLPIPAAEVSKNPNMVQNPNY